MTGFDKHGFDLCSKLSFGTIKIVRYNQMFIITELVMTGFVITGLIHILYCYLPPTNLYVIRECSKKLSVRFNLVLVITDC
jgi:hypothetical protein